MLYEPHLLHIQLDELGEHVLLAHALEEALAALEQRVERRTLGDGLEDMVGRVGQQALRHEPNHAIVNRKLQRPRHVAQQGNTVVGDGIVELLSVLADLDIVKGGHNLRQRAGAQVQLLLLRDQLNLIRGGNHDHLLHG